MLPMHWVEFKIRMLQQGIYTQKALAEKLGVNPSTITRLLRGERRSRRLEKRIGEILGIEPDGKRPREK